MQSCNKVRPEGKLSGTQEGSTDPRRRNRMAGNRQHKPLTTSVGSTLSLVGDRIHVVARAAMRHGRRGFSIVTTRDKRPDAGNETVKNHYR